MGLIHTYYGDGKGKTTSALGAALRAAGAGMRVHIVQFLKGSEASELSAIAKFPEITLSRLDKNYGFTFSMTDDAKAQLKERHDFILNEAICKARIGEIDMLILDEALDAYSLELVDKAPMIKLLTEKPSGVEIIITGHQAIDVFVTNSDYVTEFRKIAHPYDRHVAARKGIEH